MLWCYIHIYFKEKINSIQICIRSHSENRVFGCRSSEIIEFHLMFPWRWTFHLLKMLQKSGISLAYFAHAEGCLIASIRYIASSEFHAIWLCFAPVAIEYVSIAIVNHITFKGPLLCVLFERDIIHINNG